MGAVILEINLRPRWSGDAHPHMEKEIPWTLPCKAAVGLLAPVECARESTLDPMIPRDPVFD